MPIVIDGSEVTYYLTINPSSLSYYQSTNSNSVQTVRVTSSQSALEQDMPNYRIQFSCGTNQYGYDVFEVVGD